MITVFLENKLLSGTFLILLLLSIICQIMIGVIYRNMIKETDNMSATGNKLLKQCKLKFANCYQLGGGVANIPVFVDKFLTKVSFMGISLISLQHLSGQFMLLAVVAAGIGSCREIIDGETVGKVLPYYIVSFLGLYVYFAISGLVDIQGKKERLKTNLVDYLENHMVNKLRQSSIDWKELTGEIIGTGAGESRREGKETSEEEAMEAQKKTKALREEIGLSAMRTEHGGHGVYAEPNDKIDHVKKDAGTYISNENGAEEKAVFSRKEEQELEELLREFFV